MTGTAGGLASLHASATFARPMKQTCVLVLILTLIVQPIISDARKLVESQDSDNLTVDTAADVKGTDDAEDAAVDDTAMEEKIEEDTAANRTMDEENAAAADDAEETGTDDAKNVAVDGSKASNRTRDEENAADAGDAEDTGTDDAKDVAVDGSSAEETIEEGSSAKGASKEDDVADKLSASEIDSAHAAVAKNTAGLAAVDDTKGEETVGEDAKGVADDTSGEDGDGDSSPVGSGSNKQRKNGDTVKDLSCKVHKCGAGWVPKPNHHKLTGNKNSECCQKTCELYTCPDGYKGSAKYFTNLVEDAPGDAESEHACCDQLCKAYNCKEGYMLRENRKEHHAESHDYCCDFTCASFPCTGTWNNKTGDPKLRIGRSVADCCDESCGMWKCTGSWSVKEDAIHKTGTSNEACCWQNCTQIPECPDGHVNRTKANKTEEGACCLATCSLFNCTDGFVKPMALNAATGTMNISNDDAIGDSDSSCCLETCSRHNCTGKWAENPRKVDQAIVLDSNGSANPFCCHARCSLHTCNVLAGWSKDSDKDMLVKDDDPSCCQKNCRLVDCATDKPALNVLQENLTGLMMNSNTCCELQACADFRKGKRPVSAKEGCKSIKNGEDCLASYEMSGRTKEGGRKLTACGFLQVKGESFGCVALTAADKRVEGCGPPMGET
mmetsp:Transcript_88477/g.156930  ORF Transcript_88477/g.156930 Transcript_88477/m.156930 type:complete len:668 (+) Transcript_88477:73-2076(+)